MSDSEESPSETSFFDQLLSTKICSRGSNSYEKSENEDKLLPPLDILTASSKGDYLYVKHLLKQIDPNSVNEGKWTALMYAVHNCQENVVKLLVENGASLHTCNAKGLNVLMMAARWGYEPLVKNFIQSGSVIEARDSLDWTALFHAVNFNHLGSAEILLKYRANPNAYVRLSGRTPLMCAASNGNCDMVELLLRAGAFPSFRSMSGHDAESLAAEAGHSHLVTLLNSWKLVASSLLKGPEAIRIKLPLARHRKDPLEDEFACSTLPPDLDSFLSQIGLEAYLPLFREHQVDLLVFLSLTDKDLQDCGVTKLGPRRIMMESINRWHSNASLRTGIEAVYAQKLVVEKELLKTQLIEWKEKYSQVMSVFKEMRRCLDECHEQSCLARDYLSSSLPVVSALPLPQLTSDLTYYFNCAEDIYRITGIRENIETSFTT